jgi:predicted amidohydrolase
VENPKFLDDNRRADELLAASLPPIPTIVGFVGRANSETGKRGANCAALLADGKIVFEQTKMLLPTYDVFDEARTFAPASEQRFFPSAARRLRSRFAKTAGTTAPSGSTGSTPATR